jgi:hypothetical protein
MKTRKHVLFSGKRLSTGTNTQMREMLELSNKDFKQPVIITFNVVKEHKVQNETKDTKSKQRSRKK